MDTVSAGTRVYQHLKSAILGRIHAEGALLSAAEIAAAVGVSRTPGREALLRLESEGLVTLYPKRGVLVLPVSAREIEDVIDARRLVEVHAAGRAWQRRTHLAGELAPLVDQMRAARDAGDAVALMTADRCWPPSRSPNSSCTPRCRSRSACCWTGSGHAGCWSPAPR